MEPGELRLYRAVMLQTLRDVADVPNGGCSPARASAALRLKQRAMQWVEDDARYAFSFRDCCRVLGLNLQRARSVLGRIAANRFRLKIRNCERRVAIGNLPDPQ